MYLLDSFYITKEQKTLFKTLVGFKFIFLLLNLHIVLLLT